MKLDLGQLSALRAKFVPSRDLPSVAGISGGRTSAAMGALLSPETILSFQNTGKEDDATYDFIGRLEDAYEREIVRLEWRPPVTFADPPKMFRFERVSHRALDRSGDVFRGMLQAVADYRRVHKGLGPVAPWARQRLCTAYLKHRVQAAYMRELGHESYEQFVGLRFDEPDRVHDLYGTQRAERYFRTPLHDAEITKPDVLRFWSRQTFDLELEEPHGNCTGCFLKDEADKSRLMFERDSDFEFWKGIQEDFPGFGGRGRPSYEQLRNEAPLRFEIERALRAGEVPENDGSIESRRFLFVVKQEERRIAEGARSISCACERTIALTDADDERLMSELTPLPMLKFSGTMSS
jgi:hypothetical protein